MIKNSFVHRIMVINVLYFDVKSCRNYLLNMLLLKNCNYVFERKKWSCNLFEPNVE